MKSDYNVTKTSLPEVKEGLNNTYGFFKTPIKGLWEITVSGDSFNQKVWLYKDGEEQTEIHSAKDTIYNRASMLIWSQKTYFLELKTGDILRSSTPDDGGQCYKL